MHVQKPYRRKTSKNKTLRNNYKIINAKQLKTIRQKQQKLE